MVFEDVRLVECTHLYLSAYQVRVIVGDSGFLLLCSCDVVCTIINSLCLLIQKYILKYAMSCCISRDFILAELTGCGSAIPRVMKLKKMLQSFGMLGIWHAQDYRCCNANVKLACHAFARTMWFCNSSMSGGDGMALHSPPPYLQA